MITSKALDSVTPIDQQLTDSGKHLTVLQGSLLDHLVKANASALTQIENRGPESEVPYQRILEDSKHKALDGEVEHDSAMAEAVELVSESVQGTLALARTEVIPASKRVLELYGQELDKLVVDAKQAVTIVPNVYHDIWAMPQLEGLVDRFINVPLNETRMGVSLPMITGAEIEVMIKTGIDSLDEEIIRWYRDQDPERAVSTYRTVFVDREVPIGRPTNAVHQVPGSELTRNDLLLCYLIANGFEEHMPDGVNAPLEELRRQLAKMREQAGRAIAAELRRRTRDLQTNYLVFAVRDYDWSFSPDGRKVVFVNNDVYLKYLNEGGTVEAIYGAALDGARMEYNILMENAEQYTKKWNKFIGLHNQRVAAQVYRTQREAARLAMSMYINEQEQENLVQPKADLHKKTVACLGKIQPKQFEDEAVAIRTLVCDVMYEHTNAKMVLDAMDTAELDNPDLNPRECALYATLDLLARWMAAQIEVNYHK
jgi:hypothetical protein